mmetsp:Transcript_23480/g.32785  ORF Transcript_23480/g.32785 Transcript_23480/m.32785 type:complete len:96 (+) Transcript_23480:758-1045(+)
MLLTSLMPYSFDTLSLHVAELKRVATRVSLKEAAAAASDLEPVLAVSEFDFASEAWENWQAHLDDAEEPRGGARQTLGCDCDNSAEVVAAAVPYD